jgi:hypothetical protein
MWMQKKVVRTRYGDREEREEVIERMCMEVGVWLRSRPQCDNSKNCQTDVSLSAVKIHGKMVDTDLLTPRSAATARRSVDSSSSRQ